MKISIQGFEINFVEVHSGTFVMGAYPNDSYAPENEFPRHKVTLSSFLIMESLVHQDLWEAIMGNNPSVYREKNNPVEAVTFDECLEFIDRINKCSTLKFSLPTEAQWEYAASPEGRVLDSFFDENSTNLLGVKDINTHDVFEWCKDWYGKYNAENQINPQGPSTGELKVLRGGVKYWPKTLRISNRGFDYPNNECNLVGPTYSFRLVINSSSVENTQATIRERAFAKNDGPFTLTQDGKKLIKCKAVKSVKIPFGIETICDYAFQIDDEEANMEIESVILPKSVLYIGNEVFYGCSNLHSIFLPNSLQQVGDLTFAYTKIKTITLPESLVYIGKNPFISNNGIEIICSNNGIFEVKQGILYNKSTKEAIALCCVKNDIEIYKDIEIINAYCFSNRNIDTLMIHPNIKQIHYGAFIRCTIQQLIIENDHYQVKNGCILTIDGKRLINFYKNSDCCLIPDGVEEVCKLAFAYSQVKDVTFPRSLKKISEKAFLYCEHLTLHIYSKIEICSDAFMQLPYGYFTVSKVFIPKEYKEVYNKPSLFGGSSMHNLISYNENE